MEHSENRWPNKTYISVNNSIPYLVWCVDIRYYHWGNQIKLSVFIFTPLLCHHHLTISPVCRTPVFFSFLHDFYKTFIDTNWFVKKRQCTQLWLCIMYRVLSLLSASLRCKLDVYGRGNIFSLKFGGHETTSLSLIYSDSG